MRELATKALHAAMREDWDAVRQSFTDLSADGHAITFALMAWCDTTIGAQAQMQGLEIPPDGPAPGIAQPGWLDVETGRVTLDADQIPPAARWAGRLVAARAAMDHDQFRALIGAMPGDGSERAQYAFALLRGCAEMAGLARRQDGAA